MAEMGSVAGAGLLAHVPTIMLPRAERLELNEGKEISLVPGLERLRREVFEVLDYDTVVVLDSHWHTTVEFVVAAEGLQREHRAEHLVLHDLGVLPQPSEHRWLHVLRAERMALPAPQHARTAGHRALHGPRGGAAPG